MGRIISVSAGKLIQMYHIKNQGEEISPIYDYSEGKIMEL